MLDDDIKQLNLLYQTIPPTKCSRNTCAKWCCTKYIESEFQGKFVSLPLLYSIEFMNIEKFLKESSIDSKIMANSNDIERSDRLCPFFDEQNNGCSIYEVRPLSCRLYGRKIPNNFFGLNSANGMTDRVFCEDVELNVIDETTFVQNFNQYYNRLGLWSIRNSIFCDKKKKIIEQNTGLKDIYLCGWTQFNFLKTKTVAWFESFFNDYWKIYADLI